MTGRSGRKIGTGRAPLGLAGAVSLVLALEAGAFRAVEPASFVTASWAEGRRAAGHEAVGCEVLCLGDSQVKAGLLPPVMERRLGRRVFNLAVVGGQAAATDALFDRALKAGARPKAVVVGSFPGLLASDLRINTDRWAELLTPGGCLDLLASTGDAKLAGPLLCRAALGSLRRRDAVRAAVFAALGVGHVSETAAAALRGRDEAWAYRRNWRVNAGAHALPVNPAFRDGVPEAARGTGDRWRPKPENLLYLRRFLARAGAAGAHVFWLLPTTAPALRAERERDGRDPAYARLVRALQAEFPGLTVLDAGPVLSDPSAFADVYHLDRRGAVGLSAAVAAAIEPYLTGDGRPVPRSRWVELTAPRAGPGTDLADARVEDVEQSARRVREAFSNAGRLAAGAAGGSRRR